jgi:transposase InsO family protein
MCRVLGVSRSGYYEWLYSFKSPREIKNAELLIEIRKIFKESQDTYGSGSIADAINEKPGWNVNKKRVARIMRENGIRAKTKKKFKVTTDPDHNSPISPNLLNRNFTAIDINLVWVSDITYVWTKEGWLYLATILDLCSRKIVGWSMSERITRGLVIDAFNQAAGRRGNIEGLIFHSDRGSQYASKDFRALLEKHKCISSMSGSGNCYDNAVAESFFHTLKTELVYHETYETRREAISSIFEYIEVFYNRMRRHTSIGGMSPEKFEASLLQKAA